MPLFTVALSAIFISYNHMTVGGAIAILNISGALTEPVSLIGSFISDWNIAKCLLKKDVVLLQRVQSLRGKVVQFGNLLFRSVKYSLGEKDILKNISFSVVRGETVVIKGKSGVGKSTLFNLILGFIPLLDVDIRINHRSISDICAEDIRESIKLVEQKTIVFQKTIRDNLCLGDEFSENEIEEAVQAAQLSSVIQEKGYDFAVAENGSNLSGGELQRIGLCRMLLRRPEILLLDEPTSALDEKTAQKMVQSLQKFCKKREMTVLVITHRDDFEKIADQVVYITE